MKKFIFASSLWLIHFLGLGQCLSGVYTIGGTGANYNNITAALADLNTKGICGPVDFKIANGIYIGSCTMQSITGSSTINTITLESASGDSSQVLIKDSLNSLLTLQSNNVIVKKIGFLNMGPYTSSIYIPSYASGNITITNCYFSTFYSSNTDISVNLTNIASTINISNNHFLTLNAYAQAAIGFGSTGVIQKAIISDNIIEQHSLAISTQNIDSLIISGNKCLYPSLNLPYNSNPTISVSTKKFLEISNNLISGFTGGIEATIVDTAYSAQGYVVKNNIVNIYLGQGINVSFGNGVNVCFNTINIQTGAYNNYYAGMQINNCKNSQVKNNIINCLGHSYALLYSNNINSVCDYNNYYMPSDSIFSSIGSAGQLEYNLYQWRLQTGQDMHSTNYKPQFVSNLDFHLNNDINLNNKGIYMSNVTNDFDGNARNNPPDMGAYEFNATQLTNDAALTLIDVPAHLCEGSNSNVSVTLYNNGADTLRSALINWSINNNIQTPLNWTGALPPNNSAVVALGTFSAGRMGQYNIQAYTTLPNGVVDNNTINDTITTGILYSMLNGTYTIGGSGSDFIRITDAINALQLRGICGPVIFNINNGIYNESLVIDSIVGSSAINTIIFQSVSNNYNNVQVVQLPSISQPLELIGTDYITFKSMSFIIASNGFGSTVVSYLHGCNYLTFDSIQFKGNSINSSSSIDAHTVFKNCNIQAYLNLVGGNSTIGQNLEYGLSVTNCYFNGSNNGITITKMDSVIIKGNRFVSNAEISNQTLEAIHINGGGGNLNISKNYIQGGYSNGIDVYFVTATAASPLLVANNSVAGIKGMNTAIVLSHVNYGNVVYNSCFMADTSSSSNNNGAYNSTFAVNNCTQLNALNNVFVKTGDTGIVASLWGASQFSTLDNNIYYTKGLAVNAIQYNGSFISYASYLNQSGKDVHSKFINPLYTSTTDLHYNNDTINGTAVPLAYVTDDMQNKLRNATIPNPGAFETAADTTFDTIDKDLAIKTINDTLIIGNNQISVTVLDTISPNINPYHIYNGVIDTIDFSYKINNNAWVTEQWVGSLGVNQQLNYNFNTQLAITKGKLYYLTVRAKIHSTTAHDVNTANDSLRSPIKMLMAGTYYVGGTNPDFMDGDTAFTTLELCHEAAPVTFSFRPGNYSLWDLKGLDTLTVISETGINTDVVLNCNSFLKRNLTVKKVTIIANNEYYSGTYNYMGLATLSQNLIIDSCIVQGTPNYFPSGTGSAPAGGLSNGFAVYTSGNVRITNNVFKHLNIGLIYNAQQYVFGGIANNNWNSRHIIENNVFDSVQTAFLIATSSTDGIAPQDSIHFRYNTITHTDTGIATVGYGGMYLRVYGNKIASRSSAITINNQAPLISTPRILFYNNFLSSTDTISTDYFSGWETLPYQNTISVFQTQNVSLINNSIYGGVVIVSSTNAVFQNNTVFSDTLLVFVSDDPTNVTGGHNNYYTQGSILAYYAGGATLIPNLDSLKAYFPNEASSISYNPYYYNATNLHSNSMFLKGKAFPSVYVTSDIDGDIRNSTNPDIGADEITLINDVVWPGDANADSKADNIDLLSIGLYNGSGGTSRASTGNNWSPYVAANWAINQYNGVDYKHADCDGNGIINDDDTMAIVQNFNLYHNTNTRISTLPTVNSTGNDLYFVMPHPKAIYNMGDTIYADVWLGRSFSPITSIYGVAFSIETFTGAITNNSFKINLPSSWLGVPHQNAYTFGKPIEQTGTAYVAYVRNNHTAVNGYGKIASVYFVYNGATLPSNGMPLNFLNVVAVDANGNFLTLTPHNNNATNYTPLDIKNYIPQSINIYPNPVQNSFVIETSLNEKQQLQITDVSGKLILEQNIIGNTVIVTDKLENGIYFVQLKNSEGTSIQKLVVQH